MRNYFLLCMTIAICATISGCSDNLSNSGLAKEIDESLKLDEDSMQCMRVSKGGFPINVDERDFKESPFIIGLVKSGLATGKAVTIRQGMYQPDVDAIELNLTEKGMKAELVDSENRICYGRKGVAEVTQWTEPGQGANTQEILVYYKWKIVDSPDWVDKDNFSEIEGMIEPLEDKARMTKMNDGWKVKKSD